MSFGFLLSPFDDFSPVWGNDFHSPWTHSPRFCSVHGRPLSSFGATSFRGGHRRKARAKAREENAEVPYGFEAPLPRKVDSEREKTTPCKPEEHPSENEETYEEKVLESEKEKAVRTRVESCAAALQETLDLSANDVSTDTPQNTEDDFEPAVASPRESANTDDPEVEEKLEVIQGQLSKALELVPRVEACSGNVKERLYLEEHLTRCILELDKVEANGYDVVKSNRKAAIREIESLLGDLDGC